MHASTRIIALRAATKVAVSAAIMGCGGSVRDGGGITNSHALEDGAAGDALLSTVVSDASAVRDGFTDVVARAEAGVKGLCSGVTDNVDAAVSRATFGCCIGYLEAENPDSGFTGLDASAPSKACCAAVVGYVEHADAGLAARQAATPVLYQCCDALSWNAGVACDAWGPPVPPAFRGRGATA
jgi:hypothetical protein